MVTWGKILVYEEWHVNSLLEQTAVYVQVDIFGLNFES